jgi:hypothetical protein
VPKRGLVAFCVIIPFSSRAKPFQTIKFVIEKSCIVSFQCQACGETQCRIVLMCPESSDQATTPTSVIPAPNLHILPIRTNVVNIFGSKQMAEKTVPY